MQPGPRRACATRWTRCSRRRPSARAPAALVRGPGRGPRPRACPVCVGAGIAGASVQHAGCSPACRRCGGPRLALAQGSKPCALCAAPPTAPSSSPAPRAQTARRSTTTTSRTPRARSRCWRRRCRRRCRRPARPRRTPTAPRAAPAASARSRACWPPSARRRCRLRAAGERVSDGCRALQFVAEALPPDPNAPAAHARRRASRGRALAAHRAWPRAGAGPAGRAPFFALVST